MDSQLLFFCQLALLCALRLWRTHSKTRNRTKWLCLTGLAAGAAFSIKHTALATPGLIAVISFFGLHFLREPLTLLECLFAGACGFVVYTVPFYIVFNTLWHAGGKYDKFMPMNFRSTLIGSENYSPSAKRRPFWELFIYLNKRMVQSNASIKKRHTWESDWYQWIVNWRGVLYFLRKEDVDGKQMRTQIYLLGNPVVIYLTLMCVVSFAVIVMFSVRYREMFKMRASYSQVTWLRSTGTFLLSGWLCNLLPYILVDRAAFIYHYMPGLFYGQLLTGVMFDFFPPRARLVLVVIVIFAMMSAFVYWSPWIYGIALENDAHVKRRWLPRWT